MTGSAILPKLPVLGKAKEEAGFLRRLRRRRAGTGTVTQLKGEVSEAPEKALISARTNFSDAGNQTEVTIF